MKILLRNFQDIFSLPCSQTQAGSIAQNIKIIISFFQNLQDVFLSKHQPQTLIQKSN